MAANNPGPAATGLMQLEADIDVDDMQRRVDLITSNHTVRDAIWYAQSFSPLHPDQTPLKKL